MRVSTVVRMFPHCCNVEVADMAGFDWSVGRASMIPSFMILLTSWCRSRSSRSLPLSVLPYFDVLRLKVLVVLPLLVVRLNST